jgi:hypothetical protein
MGASLNDVIETLVLNLAKDTGAKVLATAQLTADDGDGKAEASDVAMNYFTVNEATESATLGGWKSSGNFRFDWLDSQDGQARAFVDEIKDVLADLKALFTSGGAVSDSDVLEAVLRRFAEAFDVESIRDANFTGDDLIDNIDYRGSNILSISGDKVTVGGRDTSGNYTYDFDDAATAQAFFEVAQLAVSWGADVF